MQRGAHDAAVMQHFVAQSVETLSPTYLKFLMKFKNIYNNNMALLHA